MYNLVIKLFRVYVCVMRMKFLLQFRHATIRQNYSSSIHN